MVFPYFIKKFIEETAKRRKNKEEIEKILNSNFNLKDGFKYFSELTVKPVYNFAV